MASFLRIPKRFFAQVNALRLCVLPHLIQFANEFYYPITSWWMIFDSWRDINIRKSVKKLVIRFNIEQYAWLFSEVIFNHVMKASSKNSVFVSFIRSP